jgi:small subunit ribosomal protein S1
MSHPASPETDVEARTAPSEDASFARILSEFEQSHQQEAGRAAESRRARVVAVTADSVFADIGLKMEGVLPLEDFRDAKGEVKVKAGDELDVSITGKDAEGYYKLSKLKVERPKDWSSLEKAFAGGHVIGGVVTGVVKGGLSVDVGVRAFLPASRSGARDAAEVEALVGQEIRCKIIELNVASEDVVVDRRAVLAEEKEKARQKAFEELREGAEVEGTVRSLTEFGAFLDLGGFDGLLHVTDIAWGRVGKPSDVVGVGDSLRVRILKIDPATRKISLGLKQLSQDPWTLAAERYTVGQRVRGKVVRLADFGAFVELEPGVDGLIHLSEMSWSRKTPKPRDILKRGEQVEVVVLGVNQAERRIALGLKQALGDPWEQVDARFPAGKVVEASVVTLANFGAFVDLGDGFEGMIHIGDISREKRLKHPKEVLAVGQTVKAQVLGIDRERRRIRLGMKQLEPTTADEYIAEHSPGDLVTGRLSAVTGGIARVELGEGVEGRCQVPAEPYESSPTEGGKANLATLTAMLSSRWKHGASSPAAVRREPVRAGQVRSFRILTIDREAKRIELELAG